MYTVTWDSKDGQGNDVPSGVYFCQLRIGGTSRGNRDEFMQTNRLLLLK